MASSKRPKQGNTPAAASDAGPVKQWDVRTLPLQTQRMQSWGLTRTQLGIAVNIMRTLETGSSVQSLLSFTQLQKVVAALYAAGLDTSRLGAALDAYADKVNDPDTRLWQQTLRSLFSPQGTDPYNLVIDGQWGKTTNEAMNYMIQAYHLAASDRSPELLQQLRDISERIVRIRCTDDTILLKLDNNPFCIIDNTASAYELKTVRNDGMAVFDVSDNQELLEFTEFFGIPKPNLAPFNRFSAWWMLLRLGSVASMAPNQIFLSDAPHPRTSVDDLETGAITNDFFQRPDRVLTLSTSQGKLTIDFLPPPSFGYMLIAVFFTADLNVYIHTAAAGELSYDFTTTGFVQPNQPQNKSGYINGQLQFRKKADYLKLFVIKDLIVNNAPHYGQAFPGIDQPAEFYAIISAPKNNILYTATIGLSFEPDPSFSSVA